MKVRATVAAGPLLGLFVAQGAHAITTVATDVGADLIATHDESNLFDCDVDYDKQTLLAVRPMEKTRDTTITGLAQAHERITDHNSLQAVETDAAVNGEWRLGMDKFVVNLSSNYTNQALWGCAASVAARLQRERDIQNRIIVPGDSVHTSTASVGYVHGRDGERDSLTVSQSHQYGDETAIDSKLEARLDRMPRRNMLLNATYGNELMTGSFDNFVATHAGGGVYLRPVVPWELGLDTDVQGRNTGENRYTTKAVTIYHFDRTKAIHTIFIDRRVKTAK